MTTEPTGTPTSALWASQKEAITKGSYISDIGPNHGLNPSSGIESPSASPDTAPTVSQQPSAIPAESNLINSPETPERL